MICPAMRGYNAETMLRLARHDLAQPAALEQFLTRCIRASHGRYEIASAGAFVEGVFTVAIVLVPIFWVAAAVTGNGWAGCGGAVSFVVLGLLWLVYMAVAGLRILRSVRRTRDGRCAVCGYQIDAAPPIGALASIATCPECGEEVIVGRTPARGEPAAAADPAAG